jgi:hypothetical protein
VFAARVVCARIVAADGNGISGSEKACTSEQRLTTTRRWAPASPPCRPTTSLAESGSVSWLRELCGVPVPYARLLGTTTRTG